MSKRQAGKSPYTGRPLRRGSDLHWMTVEKVLRFLFDLHQYENQMFDLNYAAICRDTGRIFPNCVTWFDTFDLDWSFLEKRHKGKYVSWGSLSPEQQTLLKEKHDSFDGFQTKYSSPTSTPRMIEPEYVHTRPGPLYVDIESDVLLGWKSVPDTDLEVLIVQKPKKIYLPKLEDKELNSENI